MIAVSDLHRTAREYLRAAKLLRTRSSYDAAVYLCGYAVEIALKARICKTLNSTTGFPETNPEFKLKSSPKTHDKLRYFADWPTVNKWKPEQRYLPIGTMKLADTNDRIQATQNLSRVLL